MYKEHLYQNDNVFSNSSESDVTGIYYYCLYLIVFN